MTSIAFMASASRLLYLGNHWLVALHVVVRAVYSAAKVSSSRLPDRSIMKTMPSFLPEAVVKMGLTSRRAPKTRENPNLLQLRPIQPLENSPFQARCFHWRIRAVYYQIFKHAVAKQIASVTLCADAYCAFAASKSIDPASSNSKANIGLESTPVRCLPAVVSCCN